MSTVTALTLSDGSRSGSLVVAPQSFSEVMQFAEAMARCSFVPKHLRGKPADCLAVCLQALRWEMDPFSVAQKTYFVSEGAAPGYEAQLLSAVVHARAPLEGRLNVEWSGSGGDLTCTVTGKFRGDPHPKTKTCRIATITTKNSPLWKSDPEQQLAYFTVRACARLFCPDVIMGVYTQDEIEAAIGPDAAIDVTPPAPASRLDAIEQTIEHGAGGDAASSGGQPPAADKSSAWDFGEVQKDAKHRIPLKSPATREERYFATVEEWCAALKFLADDKHEDWREVWDANSTTHTTLVRSVKDPTNQGYLQAISDYVAGIQKSAKHQDLLGG